MDLQAVSEQFEQCIFEAVGFKKGVHIIVYPTDLYGKTIGMKFCNVTASWSCMIERLCLRCGWKFTARVLDTGSCQSTILCYLLDHDPRTVPTCDSKHHES